MGRSTRKIQILPACFFLVVAVSSLTAQTLSEKQRVPKVIATHNEWTASPQELFAPYWTARTGLEYGT